MPHHSTTLVVDFDDTLAITLNRDWENATPNEKLMLKLNDLYDHDWTIHIVTARGQISCNGDHIAADNKYRAQIEKWLKDHGVKYTSLSFEKKLATYYIDDKGITPEDFIEKFNRVDLKGGMSGASVYYDTASDAVFKTAKNTHAAVAWYDFASPHYNVPKIHSVIGDTIKMEKLFPYEGSFDRILQVCYDFRRFKPLHVGVLPYRYVDRCLHRIRTELGETALNFKVIEYALEYACSVIPITFSHGDFSISNIMSNETGESVYLIDPINDPVLLSSWIIDLAKLYMSIGLEHPGEPELLDEIESFALGRDVTIDCLRAHEIGHLCRVFPYAPTDKKELILERIKEKTLWFENQIHKTTIDHILNATYVPK